MYSAASMCRTAFHYSFTTLFLNLLFCSEKKSKQISKKISYFKITIEFGQQFVKSSKGSRTLRKSAKVVTMSVERPPASASDSLGVQS